MSAPATVWFALSNNQRMATEVDVTGPVATDPAPTDGILPLPVWGTVLGTVADSGLLYLVSRGPDGNYYRYPYYGGYYGRYYHAGYRPYTGSYRHRPRSSRSRWRSLGQWLEQWSSTATRTSSLVTPGGSSIATHTLVHIISTITGRRIRRINSRTQE